MPKMPHAIAKKKKNRLHGHSESGELVLDRNREWTSQEDEDLLKLVKRMPSCWWYKSSSLHRTPAQCLERLKYLLEQVKPDTSIKPTNTAATERSKRQRQFHISQTLVGEHQQDLPVQYMPVLRALEQKSCHKLNRNPNKLKKVREPPLQRKPLLKEGQRIVLGVSKHSRKRENEVEHPVSMEVTEEGWLFSSHVHMPYADTLKGADNLPQRPTVKKGRAKVKNQNMQVASNYSSPSGRKPILVDLTANPSTSATRAPSLPSVIKSKAKCNAGYAVSDTVDSDMSDIEEIGCCECKSENKDVITVTSEGEESSEDDITCIVDPSSDESVVEVSASSEKFHTRKRKKKKVTKCDFRIEKAPREEGICFGAEPGFKYRYYAGRGLFIIMEPHSKFYFTGTVMVQSVIGTCSVYGYHFACDEEQEVFSSIYSVPFSINAEDTEHIEEFKEKLPFMLEWIESLGMKESKVAVVKLTSSHNSAAKLLLSMPSYAENIFLRESSSAHSGSGSTGVSSIPGMSLSLLGAEKTNRFTVNSSWSDVLSDIMSCSGPRVVIFGGQKSGKSTLLKYMINVLLSGPWKKVYCLDLDPGQSEISVPGVLSVTEVCNPVLVPTPAIHSQLLHNKKKEVILGTVDVQPILSFYLDTMKGLVEEVNRLVDKCPGPLLVNTMGYTIGAGVDIAIDITRQVQPTHVIQLEQPNGGKRGFQEQLCDRMVNSSHRGIISRKFTSVMYRFHNLKPCFYRTGKGLVPKVKREMNTVGYFSRLWDGQVVVDGSRCEAPLSVKWTDVALHVCHLDVDFSHILLAINAQLVALCHVEDQCIKKLGQTLPKCLVRDKWRSMHSCLGWAIVQGIDPSSQELFLLTPVPRDTVKKKVNALILTANHLPPDFYGIFAPRGGPYYMKIEDECSAS